MIPIGLNVFVFLIFTSKCLAGLNLLSTVANITRPINELTTDDKDFIEIAYEYGYHAEQYNVTTSDGYILGMFRIPPKKECAKKTPVLCMHGLFQESEGYIDQGPEAPGYILSDDCYDVWFGNVRGTQHSRKHVHLNPDKDLAFWKFSVDEMGFYDIPAMIDQVLTTTDSKKLIYIGFSQGGCTFLIMNSERPEYADKISLFIGLAPSSRQYYTKSVPFRTASVGANALEAPLEAVGVWEILSKGFPIQGALSALCQVELLSAIACGLVLSLVDSPHPDSLTPEIEKRLVQHAPAGTSIQNFARYGQAMNNLKFVKFDYGSDKNIEVYGSSQPPEYNLKAVTMPTVIFHGKSDHVVDMRDVEWVVGQLPNLLEFVNVEDPLWNHLDMTYSRYWRKTIYNTTMKPYLSKYDSIY